MAIMQKSSPYLTAAVIAELKRKKVLIMGNLPWALLALGKIKFLTGRYDEVGENIRYVTRGKSYINEKKDY